MKAGKQPLPALTALRFFLALWVVWFHQTVPGSGILSGAMAQAPRAVFNLLRTGYVAVSVFFVLSGFVLAYNYPLHRRWVGSEWFRFGIARFSRIYPAYFLRLVMTFPIVAHAVASRFSLAFLGRQAIGGVLSLVLLQSWLPRAVQSWNGPGWSLSNEAFFYACFPLVGVTLWRCSRPKSLFALGVGLWAAGLLPAVGAIVAPARGFGDVDATSTLAAAALFWTNLVKFNPLFHLPDFCVGILTAKIYRLVMASPNRLIGRGYLFYVPGVIGVLGLLAYADRVPYPLVHNGLLLPLHAATVLGLALGDALITPAWLFT